MKNATGSEHSWKLRRCKSAHRSEVKGQNVKTHHIRSTFENSDTQKLHAVAVRSTFGSQNGQNTSKHITFGALLEVQMLQRWTPVWREARLEVKM